MQSTGRQRVVGVALGHVAALDVVKGGSQRALIVDFVVLVQVLAGEVKGGLAGLWGGFELIRVHRGV